MEACTSVQMVDCVLDSSRLDVTDSVVGVHRCRLTGVSAGSEAWNGALALDPQAHVVLTAGVLQANVPRSWSLAAPTAWQLRGQVFAVQAVQATAAPVLSNPVVRVVF